MKKILLYTLSCALIISSCDGFLDVKPTNQAEAKSSVGTVADAQVMMNGIMRNFVSGSSYYGLYMFLYADAKGGDYCVGGRGRGYDGLYVFSQTPQSGSLSGMWNQIYYCLALINNLVTNIDIMNEAGKGSADLNHIKAQALTARALCYFNLVRLYGKPYSMDKNALGVPLVLKVLDASAQPTRATVGEVYNQIVADLSAAVPLFKKAQRDNGYINYFACIAIQAKVHLEMQNYPSALAAAEEIITTGTAYTLYTNANWLTSWSRQYQSESIFELTILPTEADGGRGGSIGSTICYDKKAPAATSWNYYIASDTFLTRLNEDPDDIRLGLMDFDEKSEPGAMDYTPGRKGCCYKYLGGVSLPGDGKSTITAVNVKVIRLSEIYLIAAEAALLSQNKAKAATYLQAIRKRSPNLAPATEANVTLKMIQDERSKELFGEGHRFFDMMRWNETIVYSSDYRSQSPVTTRPASIDRTYFKAVLPIDIGEINANPAIASQQNPGY